MHIFCIYKSGYLLKDFYQVILSIVVLERTNIKTYILRTLCIMCPVIYKRMAFESSKLWHLIYTKEDLYLGSFSVFQFEVVLAYSIYFIVEIVKSAHTFLLSLPQTCFYL